MKKNPKTKNKSKKGKKKKKTKTPSRGISGDDSLFLTDMFYTNREAIEAQNNQILSTREKKKNKNKKRENKKRPQRRYPRDDSKLYFFFKKCNKKSCSNWDRKEIISLTKPIDTTIGWHLVIRGTSIVKDQNFYLSDLEICSQYKRQMS